MAQNHLEQMIAEWYEYQGYYVKRNVLVGKREKGGYECELELIAFHPAKKRLVHIEPSLDADSWAFREKRFEKKFTAGRKYIKDQFIGLDLPDEIEQLAVFFSGSILNHPAVGGGKVVLVGDLMAEIFEALKDTRLETGAIPEHLTILRSFQFVNQFRSQVSKVWK